ncbi:MAG: integrase [Bacteroidetes bacterium]|nr:MAG: integrase [Bacteroidota bacterium]PIE88575.1 MAG: integrase [Bacteroidota bacterium]
MQKNLPDQYISYLKYEKRRSEHTLRSYGSDLGAFFAYLREVYGVVMPEEVSSGMVRSWVVAMVERDLSETTIKRRLAAIRSFYKYGIKRGVLRENPAAFVQTPPAGQRLPIYYHEAEMETLFETIAFPEGFEGVRDRLVLELLYATGMRNEELVRLRDEDIDFFRKEIKVTGKRDKQRMIPVSARMLNSVKAYTKLRNDTFTIMRGEESGRLIVSNRGAAAYPKLIYRIVYHYMAKVTTMEKKSPHKLRHTFATHMLNAGADLNTIKELLGHASLDATQIYTHNSIEQLKKVYKQAHPGA